MIRRPPRSTRTDTRFPYTTLFRSSLRVLRPSKFVQGYETLFNENTKKYTEMTGIDVRVDNESWEDLRPKTAVAANIGSGPDIILGWNDDPHQYPDKLLDVTDIAEYLGKKYGDRKSTRLNSSH